MGEICTDRERKLLNVLSALAELQELKLQQQRLSEEIIETLLTASDSIRNPHTFATYMQVLNVPSMIRADVFKILSKRKIPDDSPIRMQG